MKKLSYKLSYKDGRLLKYIIALTGQIPVFNTEKKEIVFKPAETLNEVIAEMKRSKRLIDLRKTLEAVEVDYWREFTESMRVTSVTLRLKYPFWFRIYFDAVKNGTSVSNLIRKISLNRLEEWVNKVKNEPSINPKAIEIIQKQISKMRNFPSRKSDERLILIEGYYLIEDSEILEKFEVLIKQIVKNELAKRKVSTQLADVFLSYLTVDPVFFVYIDFKKLILNIEYFELFIPKEISRGVSAEGDKYFEHWYRLAVEFPLKILHRFSAGEIYRFVNTTGFPAFRNMEVEEINKLKESLGELNRFESEFTDDIVKKIYRNGGFNPYKNPEYVLAYTDGDVGIMWGDFKTFDCYLKIPLEFTGDAVRVAGTGRDLDENVLADCIKKVFLSKIGGKKPPSGEYKLEKISKSVIQKILSEVDYEISVEAASSVSEVLANEIVAKLRDSSVFSTKLPEGFVDLLYLIEGKNLSMIITDAIKGRYR